MSTSTEVRSPTRTEVRSPTRTSTWADTRDNFTSTVTGGAGTGATNVTISIPGIHHPDTGALIAGQEITKVTGIGIVAGGLIGYHLIKRHRVAGMLGGIAAGFFAGRALEPTLGLK